MLNFLHLVISPPESSVLYTGNYDPVLVSLSIVVAVFASYASLLVSQHVSSSTTATTRRMWIAIGGLCLGFGIWAMHFVGMLAFSLPCSSSYDASITLLSTVPGILASTLAIKIISRRELSHIRLALGGLLIGAGIGAMHYSGMAAMRLNGLIRYDIKLFLLSILVAIALATFALWIKFRLQLWQARWNTWVTIASAVVLGLAVSGMHYTAMAAAYFVRDGGSTIIDSGITPTFLAAIVLSATSLIIVVTIVATYVGKPNLLSLGRSYKLIVLLIFGWITIAWLSADYYYSRLANNVYQHESQLARQQVEQIASNINESIELLKGISLVISRDEDTHRVLRHFGANIAPSSLNYMVRKQRWSQDKVLGELNNTLGIAATHLGADIIIILNAAGDCIAASNVNNPGSTVGLNLADRVYFPQVQAGQPGHQYAVGRTTNVPGLFYAYPVLEKGHFIGAVVVKREITKFSYWTNQVNAFITDANGVIVLAPDKQLEFRTLPNASAAKLSAEKILLQYKRSALEPLLITPWGNARFPSAVLIGGSNLPIVLDAKILTEDTITIHVPRPLDELLRLGSERYWLFILLAAAGSMLIVAASMVVLYLRESERTAADLRIAATAFESQASVIITDTDGVILRVNKAFTQSTGYTADEAVGQTPRLLKSGRHNAEFYRTMWETIRRTGAWQGEIWNQRKNGCIYPTWLSISAVKGGDGAVTHYVGSHIDMTKSKAAEAEIQHLAFYDPLTNLPNRRLLVDRLQHALASSARSGREGALLFIDLDNFKILNDTLGHDIGDLLLKQAAQRLKSCVREDDTVARLGGDEFVVILEGMGELALDAAAQTEAASEKILDALSQPYQLGTHEYSSTTSIGATLFNGQQQEIEELLKQADIAMYQAKKFGRNTLRFFDPQMQNSINARAMVIITRTDTNGHTLQAVTSLNVAAAVDPNADYAEDSLQVQPDVYPGTLALIPGGIRQLKVHLLDPNTGAQTSISTASQSSEITTLDATGMPVLDANGVPITTTVQTSVTRYYSSDDTIASVDANGLISAHLDGRVTISVVHLVTPVMTDYLYGIDPVTGLETVTPYSVLGTQSLVIGQSDIALKVQTAQLTDNDASTPAPQAIIVSARDGAAISSDTGELVMIGAGALAQDTAVSISRINVADLAALGLVVPSPTVLQPLAAFKLDIGSKTSAYPLQLAIPVQGGLAALPGEEVIFLRKGKVITPDSSVPGGYSYQDTWWLVDNGYIGADGVARTASPPYDGLDESGEYLVCKSVGVISSPFELRMGVGDILTCGGLSFCFSVLDQMVTTEMIGIVAARATTGSVANYHFGIPHFVEVAFPAATPGEIYKVNIGELLPTTSTPYGNVVLPNISKAELDDVTGEIILTLDNADPGEFVGQLEVRAVFADGSYQKIFTYAGTETSINLIPPDRIAVASVGWQVLRKIPTSVFTGSGELSDDEPLYFAGNTVHIEAKSDMAVVLTRKGIDLYRENKQVGHTTLMLDNDQSLGFDNLTGSKVQPVVFSADLSTIFIGGNSFVYAIDSMTFKLIDTLNIPLGRNISSMAVAGNLLLIGEGQRYGAVGSRLLAMNIRPGDKDYGNVASIDSADITGAPNGISGMTVGPDGKTLVVATPLQNPISQANQKVDRTKRGNVLVFDLSTLKLTGDSFKDGITLAAAIKAELPEDGFSGKAPETITATKDADRYLVADIADYDRGLATLVITRDDTGKITGAKMASIRMSQDSDKIFIDRLDIQRAQSAVLVKYQDIEYAIVSDDNRHGLDPYWQAMYEAPMFMFTPSGPPIAVGGSADARKVAVGGKLGIVKDPFGAAQYLGATLPLDGYGIVNLSLSEDGKVLLGQLAGLFSGNILSSDNQLKPSKSGVWNVDTLIQAALDLPEKDRMTKHIKMPANSEQLLKDNTGWVAGTYFDPKPIETNVVGRMGDIVEVDLKWHTADAIARDRLGYLSAAEEPEDEFMLPWHKEALARERSDIMTFDLEDFTLDKADIFAFADDFADPTYAPESNSLKLITKEGKSNNDIYSRSDDLVNSAEFKDTGRMFMAPNITDKDEKALRDGDRIKTDKQAQMFYTVKVRDEKGDWEYRRGIVTVVAKDIEKVNTFFGDRPLDNPGYSAFKLKGTVSSCTANDVLDVYRVEQRLKYLGFPAMGTGSGNTLKEFDVDGDFGLKEEAALKLFEKVVRYENSGDNARFNNVANGADGAIAPTEATSLNWLNAYNAPHWMQFFASVANSNGPAFKATNGQLKGWTSSQLGQNSAPDYRLTAVEVYGTSWMRDLLAAKDSAAQGLHTSQNALFNGAVDANYGVTPQGVAVNGIHKTHDLGMAFDLGFRNFISPGIGPVSAQNVNEVLKAAINSLPTVSWSIANAVLYSQPPASQSAADQLLALSNTNIPANDQVSAIRNLLSLFAVVRSDPTAASGTWDTLNIVSDKTTTEEAQIRAALFGDGSQAGALISDVLFGKVGANQFANMKAVLEKLTGISAGLDDKNHFHIYLRPPTMLPIGTANLLADTALVTQPDTVTTLSTQQIEAQGLLDYAQTIIDTGDEFMFTLDIPYVPVQDTPIVLAQAATPSSGGAPAGSTLSPDYMLTGCQEMPSMSEPASAERFVDPIGFLAGYYYENPKHEFDPAAASITLLKEPTHGKIVLVTDNVSWPGYRYDAQPGYAGKDQVVFQAQYHGKTYKVVVNLLVSAIETIPDNGPGACPAPQLIKVNGKPVSSLSSYDLNTIPVTFADLAGSALGQTTGNNITLDTNAANHNWFIDATPGSNEEFLPTSNPYEWVAKEGSAAYGKMDMLSVLLHEYGHALGIEHSADTHDYMATTLTAGVRRMPSAEELALMQQLVGEVKVEMASVSTQGSGNTPSQLPLLPLGGFGLAFLGRLRGSRYGSLNVEADLSTLVTQFAVTANEKLTNGNFSVASGMPVDNGWATQGSVDFIPASTGSGQSGSATLKEISTSQTRLNQVFVVNPRDRFLSFTIAGSVLDDVNGAPDDAFEVALLDANTGLSLAGAFSLTHTDAMLNLQADGTETAASSVTRVTNPDGSRTYRVDLSGIAVGTAVNLSFDLIGFGKSTSEITVRDVRVSGLPELHDDTATMNEDGSLAFDPFAQVDNAALLQLGSHVVDQPAHGTVTVNADGTFAYTPAADYFGTDSFTYRLNDGPLESNLATVTVTVAAVNDAPVVADVYANIAEDTPLQITLGAHASDVDSTTLSIQIVDGPAHGVLVTNADGSYTYTAEANYFGPDSFTYKANDADFAGDPSALDSNIATVNLNIIPVNDAPVANDVAVYSLEDNQLVLNLLGSASDIETPSPLAGEGRGEGGLSATIVTAPAHGVLSWNNDGSYTYTPDANYNGADSFTYKVNDAAFAGDPSALDSNIATVSLTIGSVNDAPTGISNTVTTLEDTPYVFQLADFGYSDANDLVGAQASRLQADGTSAIQWDNFTAVTIGSLPLEGNLTLNGVAVVAGQSISTADISAGLLLFAPTANANGLAYANFTFNVQDDGGSANGGVDIDQTARTMAIVVTAVNDAPVAVDLNFTTDEDVPLTLNLLASVIDIDSAALTPILIAGPQHGQLLYNADGSFNYVADANYFGTDSFTYKVADGDVANGALESNIVTVSLSIAAVNDAPVAVSSTVTGAEDTPYIFNWSDFKVSDADSDNLSIIINELPVSGLLQHFDGLRWTAVAAGQRATKADIDAGLLCFGPDLNESGFAGFNMMGTGNMLNNYASFTYQADDGILTSAIASMSINITPVADDPSLTLAVPLDGYGATSKVFGTSWETACNRSPTFTILPQSSLEGWRVVKEAELEDDYHHDRNGDGHYDDRDACSEGQEAFVIWSNGDKMKDNNHTNRIVKAATGNGNNWLEIGDAMGLGHQTYGIERAVSTRAGATYNLSLDYAGRLGYSAEYTRIGIYVDNIQIASYASTSPNTALNWENLNFSFVGNGMLQSIRIKADGMKSECNGRGAMIDDIKLTEAMPINTGYQGGAIRLSAVIAALTDMDGSEVLGVTIGAIPTGAILTDGTNSFTATDLAHLASITGWNLANLSITAPTGFTGTFALTVAASATETATGETAHYALNLPVTVVPTNVTSPLVIDLNGNGVQTTAYGDTQGRFNLLNNGTEIGSGWISTQDGFLAIDTNGNGKIDDRNELFGGEIGEGFAKLNDFDSNHDGVVNAKDARYHDLKIWQDANGNHQTDEGELRSLDERGINGVNVNHTIVPEQQNGNWLLERGTVTFKDGHTAAMADAYFEIGRAETTPPQSSALSPQSSGNAASMSLRSEQAQPKLVLGFPNDGKAIDWHGRDQVKPVTDWSTKPASSILSGESDTNKKLRTAKSTWLTSFIGAEKETKQDAASLSKLSVSLKGKE